MPDRDEALAILKRAREALLARLTEAILEQEEELMADAQGESFLSEIETLYERMGGKLAHLSQMISNLPPDPAEHDLPDDEELFAREDQPAASEEYPRLPHFPFPIPAASENPSRTEAGDLIGLPAPGVPTLKAPAFGRFVTHIEQGEVDHAGNLIGQLLGLSPFTGQRCAQVFAARYETDPGVVVKAMRIRQELTLEQYNNALQLMHECFGLQGLDAMIALQRMKDLITAPSTSGN